VKEQAAKFMKIRAVWRFFEAERDGNAIHLFEPGAASPVHTFRFGRQPKSDGLCLSDYILDADEGKRDHLALFVVTAASACGSIPRKPNNAANFCWRTPCRRWPSRPRRAAPNGCIAASARIGDFPIRPP
jgi:5-methyltetrahydrofolate--homocysteine methyltransferase